MTSLLARLFSRRMVPTAFWYLRSESLVVAILEPTADEPYLRACATVAAKAQADSDNADTFFAPGLVEAASLVGAGGLPHVAAIGEPHCTLSAAEAGRAAAEAGKTRVAIEIAGMPEEVALVAPAAVEAVVARFTVARLDLVSVDCAACARRALRDYLGPHAHAHSTSGSDAAAVTAATMDALTAVTVAPTSEAAAVACAAELVVPVGLALERFGLVERG